MADHDDRNSTPSDIITYIGVPLAVLGVLPILYNTVVTLAALSRIKRMLRHSKLTALTRSDVVNRVIEVELPRYAVTPWDRFEPAQRQQYWTLSRHPSSIPGGSWTTFNWKTNAIGNKTQRVEYADQLRQPQVEVAFDELTSYLLDLGAVPDAHGWRLLRSTGLWTPVGCALLKSPDGTQNALTVAPLDDSEGNLSLAVNWSGHWTTRSHASLPPYWVRIPAPILPETKRVEEEDAEESEDGGESSSPFKATERPKSSKSLKSGPSRTATIDTVQEEIESNTRRAISCQVSVDGLITAIPQDETALRRPDCLYIEHIRVRPGEMAGVWFASALTAAYGSSSQTILWNYKIPNDMLRFARKDSVPCGVLELLGVVDESMTPEWATKHNDRDADFENFVRRGREQSLAMQAEARLPPNQKQEAAMIRMQKESQQRLDDMRDKMRRENQRREERQMEALQSPKWNASRVAEHNLRWLKSQGHINDFLSVSEAVGVVLHRMVLEGQFANQICEILDLWRIWSDNAGMRKADFNALKDEQAIFAQASLLVAVIKESTAAMAGSLSVDLQECLGMWKKVRLG